jgi:glycosyltransferase involved in cell wall biosynthesis
LFRFSARAEIASRASAPGSTKSREKHAFSYEMIFVNDGSTDDSRARSSKPYRTEYPSIVGISFARNYGESAALHEGFLKAIGEVVIHDGCGFTGFS